MCHEKVPFVGRSICTIYPVVQESDFELSSLPATLLTLIVNIINPQEEEQSGSSTSAPSWLLIKNARRQQLAPDFQLPVSKMTWSKVEGSPSSTKWICVTSTKKCVDSVARQGTVLEMLPGTEVTLLSESKV